MTIKAMPVELRILKNSVLVGSTMPERLNGRNQTKASRTNQVRMILSQCRGWKGKRTRY